MGVASKEAMDALPLSFTNSHVLGQLQKQGGQPNAHAQQNTQQNGSAAQVLAAF
jgi:hypothetical protein